MNRRFWFLALALAVLIAGWIAFPRTNIPACRGAYSQVGDEAALSLLNSEIVAVAELAQDAEDLILLSEFRAIRESRNYRAMEEWVCRARRKHGFR